MTDNEYLRLLLQNPTAERACNLYIRMQEDWLRQDPQVRAEAEANIAQAKQIHQEIQEEMVQESASGTSFWELITAQDFSN